MRTWKRMMPVAVCAVSAMSLGVAASAGPGPTTELAWLELTGTPTEAAGPFAWIGMGEGDTLRSLVERVDEVAYDDTIDGLVIRVKDAALGVTQIQELGRAMNRLRESGKQIHVFAENYGTPEILLGAYADEVIIQSGGTVSIPGLHMEEMFLRDTLEWVGITPDYVQIGAYKGAEEQMMNTEPSPEWDENISGLLDSMYANMRGMIQDGYDLSSDELDQVMEEAWWASDKQGIALGIIDSAVDLPNLMDHLGEAYGTGDAEISLDLNDEVPGMQIDMANPFAMLTMLSKKPNHTARRPTIAVLHINGTIIDGDSKPGGFLGGGSSVGSRTIRNAIESILKQDMIKGVVVRIDSPGGSAIASEIIWQGLDRLKAEKPVWISVGSMAASGGYYIAVGGDRIYAEQSSIVGSIGVVGGKLAMGGLYDKVRIHIKERNRGPRAGLASGINPWTDEEREMVRARMKETYDQFTGHVAAGREGIDLSKTAEGRLFTGDRALDLKMVDAIGGLDDTMHELAAEVGLDDFEVMEFPGPKSFDELIEDMLGGFGVTAPGVMASGSAADPILAAMASLRTLLGEQRFEMVRDAINANLLLRDEPVLLTMPRVIMFR
jgi:protease IV